MRKERLNRQDEEIIKHCDPPRKIKGIIGTEIAAPATHYNLLTKRFEKIIKIYIVKGT